MTASLPPEVQRVFERFVTTEYTTVDAHGQPITWPVTPYYKPGAETIDLNTGIGYPKKADDAERNPKVSLLFSDPTGSGIDAPPAVLVQGPAEVDYRDLDANRERYFRESGEKLPATKNQHPPKFLRGMFDWYYARIYIKVRPERVYVWDGCDFSAEPTLYDANVEEVRSAHVEQPLSEQAAPAHRAPVWDDRMDDLGSRHKSAVLTRVAPDGFPISARVPISPERAAKRIRIDQMPEAMEATAGRACLVAHEHEPRFKWQINFQVRGDLEQVGEQWTFTPDKMVGGFELPPGPLKRWRVNAAKMRRMRKFGKGEIARRRATVS
jgi:Pyridoxamine 5'-phosphate oxidase